MFQGVAIRLTALRKFCFLFSVSRLLLLRSIKIAHVCVCDCVCVSVVSVLMLCNTLSIHPIPLSTPLHALVPRRDYLPPLALKYGHRPRCAPSIVLSPLSLSLCVSSKLPTAQPRRSIPLALRHCSESRKNQKI